MLPVRLIEVRAEPVNVPVAMEPVPLIVVVLANRVTEPVALPPVVIEPGMVILGAVNETVPAFSTPLTEIPLNEPNVKPPAALKLPTDATVLSGLLSVTDPEVTTPVKVVTLSSALPPSETLPADCRSRALATPPLPTPRSRLLSSVSAVAIGVAALRTEPSRTRPVPMPVRSMIAPPVPTFSVPAVS